MEEVGHGFLNNFSWGCGPFLRGYATFEVYLKKEFLCYEYWYRYRYLFERLD